MHKDELFERIQNSGLLPTPSQQVSEIPELLDEITQKLEKGMHQVVAERSILGGITHSEVGVWLCERWNIPKDITDIVGFHHTPFALETLTDELKLIYSRCHKY